MGLVVLPKTLVAHTDAVAADVMADLNAIVAAVNGGLDSTNLASSLKALLWESGDLKFTGRAAAPTGWLMCEGQAVSRATYAALFAAIGTAFGAGDGVTTFNVPDMRGRLPMGVDGAAGRINLNPDVRGQAGGNELLQGHAHAFNVNSGAESERHNHQVFGFANTRHEGSGFGYTNYDATPGSGFSATDYNNQSHIHNVAGATAGEGGGNSQNLAPYLTANWMIKI